MFLRDFELLFFIHYTIQLFHIFPFFFFLSFSEEVGRLIFLIISEQALLGS